MFRMYNGYFINKQIVIIYIIFLILLVGITIYLLNKNSIIQNCPHNKLLKTVKPKPIQKQVILNPINNFDNIIENPKIDPISKYDYDKVFDPLTFPNRRVQRWELPPPQIKNMIDIHTQGYPDTFRQLGVLVRETKGNDEFQQNQVLRLYGRELYPRAERYEYYTEITAGNNIIKIPITTRRGGDKELYDGDIIRIDELRGEYYVKIHDYDFPKYYPNII